MKGHAVTLQILFLREISLWWKVEKTFFSLIFWKHAAVNKFYGAIDKSRNCYTRELVRQQARSM